MARRRAPFGENCRDLIRKEEKPVGCTQPPWDVQMGPDGDARAPGS